MWLLLLFAQLTQDFSLVLTMFTKVHEKVMYNTSDNNKIHGQERYGTK